MKDVASCDKPRGAAKQALIRGYPNGSAHYGEAIEDRIETSVDAFGEPGEAKHPSNRRKRNQPRFPE
jgi:hypothetical protein